MQPDTMTAEQLRQWASRPLTFHQQAARNMYHGHHLGNGAGIEYWRGPTFDLADTRQEDAPPPAAGTTAPQDVAQAQQIVNDFRNALRKSFTSTNFIRSVTRREVKASAGRMTWVSLPAEVEALAVQWWDLNARQVERTIRDDLLTTARLIGRAPWWLRVADRALAAIPTPTVWDALRHITLEALLPESARVDRLPDTLQRIGAVTYRMNGVTCADVCWVDERGFTNRRTVRESGAPVDSRPLRMGGRLPMGEVTLEPLITEQVLQNQMAYNTVKTMGVKNTELAGFVERYGIGIEPPYEIVGGAKKYLPVKVGGGRFNFFAQQTYDRTDANGNPIGEAPLGAGQYGRLDPASSDPLETVLERCKADIYEETGQSFVLTQGSTQLGEQSREILVSEFDTHREDVQDACKMLISDILEAALALACALSGRNGDSVPTVTGQVRGRVIPQSPQDRAADLADRAAGVMTDAEIRARRGLDETTTPTPPEPVPA